MMAPVVARYYARYLLGKETHPFFDAWSAKRFTASGGAPGAPGAGTATREEMHIG